ncbi:hypothetical protein K458DRAFT_396703 [Lentithecium fluviatile CBS 122367]|uniref:Uncharacterized protein n=1 Tax=Lentithecium fluviatile CBS 122367 TaxID=1168545 RepID=A0A6G1IEZ6_9PLEO|nr:hypothetical protein K458DRAFT_396703 [Lentithecium fluviatile CBS 122367]
MRSYSRLHRSIALFNASCNVVGVAAAVSADSIDPITTDAPALPRRGLPYEDDPALFGYQYGSDYTCIHSNFVLDARRDIGDSWEASALLPYIYG